MIPELQEKPGIKGAASIVLFRDGKMLIGLRHYKRDKWMEISLWTTPAGRCDEGETVEQTLRREVQEETGITEFSIDAILHVHPGAKEGDTVYTFVGNTMQEPRLMEPEKFSEWKWVMLDEYVREEKFGGFNLPARKIILDYLQKLN